VETLNVPRTKLVKTLQKNKAKHLRDHTKAHASWEKKVLKALERAYQAAKAGKKYTTNIPDLPEPWSHEKDYDIALDMLAMTEDEQITITYHEFLQYARDEWSWKAAWALANASYGVR